MGKIIHLCVSQHHHLSDGDNDSTHPLGLFGELNKVISVKDSEKSLENSKYEVSVC